MPTDTFTPSEDCWVRGQSSTSHADAVAANGSLFRDNQGNTAYVGIGNFFCARTYYRFDTTSISIGATVTSAYVQVRLKNTRGVTSDAMEVHKLFKSSDNSSTPSSALFQTITTTSSTSTTDVGNTPNTDLIFPINGDLGDYLQDCITDNVQPAFLLRNKGDYDVATEGDPSGVNTRGFYGTSESPAPFLSITYSLPSTDTGYGNDVLGVGNSNIANVKGVATANISKVSGV